MWLYEERFVYCGESVGFSGFDAADDSPAKAKSIVDICRPYMLIFI